jgi:phosphoglucosamine mutase
MNPPIRFGTDGVRGMAGEWPITDEGAFRIGQGIANWTDGGRVFVGRDTRESGPSLQAALTRGIIRGGAVAVDLGVLPTAAVSAAVAADGLALAGVMLTASHNPWADNGIKVLASDGGKPAETTSLTQYFEAPSVCSGGSSEQHPNPLGPWLAALPSVDLRGRRILLDGAHGAGHRAALQALQAMGATVSTVGCAPNGQNINAGVGAMCPPTDLQGCDFGICLDGDADRLVMLDPTHGALDGDDLLWMLAQTLDGPVVGTVMSNGGLEAALNGRLVRTGVGDALVHAEMQRLGAHLGGEPSGHIMLTGGLPTSDGLYTALRVLQVADGGPLPVGGWTRWPQTTRNVRHVQVDLSLGAISEAESAGHRVLVRASGTEPLVRVMVEGPQCDTWARAIADALPRHEA